MVETLVEESFLPKRHRPLPDDGEDINLLFLGGSFGGGTRIPFAIILFQVEPMFFLIVLQLCTCLHYWYVKFYWANPLQSEQTHVHTITLHAHDNIFGNDEVKSFYQTMLLRPCPTWSLMVHFFFMSFHFLLFLFFFTTDCEQLTVGKHNRVQVCTASHNNSPHFYFAI